MNLCSVTSVQKYAKDPKVIGMVHAVDGAPDEKLHGSKPLRRKYRKIDCTLNFHPEK
jgi:hypothetical protein